MSCFCHAFVAPRAIDTTMEIPCRHPTSHHARLLTENRLVNVLGNGQWSEEVVPTVSFNLRQIRKGNVTMKVWDVAVSMPSYTETDHHDDHARWRWQERDSCAWGILDFGWRGEELRRHIQTSQTPNGSTARRVTMTTHVTSWRMEGRARLSPPKTLRRPPADRTMASHRAGTFPVPASKKPAQSTSQPNPGYQSADKHAGAAQVQINVGKVLRWCKCSRVSLWGKLTP